MIDIAQDHALRLLHNAGVFDLGVVLKGGTAIRKYRAGNAGRFSTDLDFAGADETTAEVILDVLDGAELDGFRFGIEPLHAHRRARLRLETPFGSPAIPARVDLSPKPAWLAPEILGPTALPIHTRYSFALPPIPVMRLEEVASEKLARYRRASLARDLYDLAWIAQRVFDERLVGRLTVLKVWHDVVDDGLGEHTFHPEDVLRPLSYTCAMATMPNDPVLDGVVTPDGAILIDREQVASLGVSPGSHVALVPVPGRRIRSYLGTGDHLGPAPDASEFRQIRDELGEGLGRDIEP